MMSSHRVLCGDAIDKLKELPDGSVQCCVTSPPYWGLRDYGTADWVGGDSECDHLGEIMATHRQGNDRKEENKPREIFKKVCGKCGAIREDKQLGLEETPEEYVKKMVDIFREVHRVLRDDGTLWLNLGDSYAGNCSRASDNGRAGYGTKREGVFTKGGDILKPKDLVGIPWRVAFALQADGWYLRQDIIWNKPNPMPESVSDRCTKAHEYIFLLTKNKKYYYDAGAIKEQAQNWGTRDRSEGKYTSGDVPIIGGKYSGLKGKEDEVNPQRNKRSVWTVSPKAFIGAHFAVFPPELITPCVLAGCAKGGTVLDPFTGSGTTGLVGKRLGCNFIGIELNPEYAEMARNRIKNEQEGLFNE